MNKNITIKKRPQIDILNYNQFLKELDNILDIKKKYLVLVDHNVSNLECFKAIFDKFKLKKTFIISYEFSEPDYIKINEIISRINKHNQNFNSIIAIGGGSTIDTAKILSILLSNKNFRLPEIFEPNLYIEFSIPIIAVSTTVATGSEISPSAVYCSKVKKTAIVNNQLIPQRVFIVPQIVNELNDLYTIIMTIDAISHSLEGILSKSANNISDCLNVKSIKIITENLPKYIKTHEIKYRENLIEGYIISAFGAQICGANLIHGLASPLSYQLKIPHGMSICYVLNFFIKSLIDIESYPKNEIIDLFVLKNILSITNLVNLKKSNKININFAKLSDDALGALTMLNESLIDFSTNDIKKMYIKILN